MSNIHHLPSEKELQEIANHIFKGQQKPISKDLSGNESVASSGQQILTTPPLENNHSSDFNIERPQTSLHDPFFKDGNVPKAVAGDGRSPGVEQIDSTKWTSSNSQALDVKSLIPESGFGNVPTSLGHFDKQNHLTLTHHETDEGSPVQKNNFNYFPNPTDEIPFIRETFETFTELANWATVPKVENHKNPFGKNPLEQGQNKFDHLANTFHTNHFDVHAIRRDFPILSEYINGRPLVWFDNAATTHKPKAVIDRLSYFYKHENSNIHRAAHELAARATDAYEYARKTIQQFINAKSVNEIVFTRGTTESINLIAQSWGEQNLRKGDDIILSNLEHHANIVPWQLLSKKIGFNIKIIPVNDNGELLLEEYSKLLSQNTRLVSFTHVSNALGTVTPAKTIIELAHQAGAKVLLDGAQSISHIKVDLQELQPDFFVFSGHKIFGPTGIGVVYGREELLNATQPYQGGGNMIKDVTFEKTIFQNSPNRFEAGTGNIADAVGLGAAIEYVQQVGIDRIAQYEHQLLDYATQQFLQIPGVQLIGTAQNKTSVMSFTLKNYSNEQVGKILNEYGIAVRTGHHCAQPILRRLGHETSVRPSFAFYNTLEEIDLLVQVIRNLSKGHTGYY